jgi:hypothetical protein
MFIIFIFYFSIILFIIVYYSNRHQEAQREIRAYMESQGREVLTIILRRSHNFSHQPNYYEIIYRTPENESYRVQCIYRVRGELFWGETTHVPPNSYAAVEPQRVRWNEPVAISADSFLPAKETLINGLTSGRLEERIETIQTTRNLEQVDELVLYIIMDMANDDPEHEVREAAKDALAYLEQAELTA